MTEKPISIIITCYNLGRYLDEALQSITQSGMEHLTEIIIVNDGSTDTETLRVLKDIASGKEHIMILNQPNMGLGKARNNGIKASTGKYIIPLDADNKLREVFFRHAISILDANPEIGVVFGNAEFFGTKTGLWKVKPFDFSEMLQNNYIDACACFRRTDWEILEGYDENMPIMGFEDWDLWLRMAVKGIRFRYVDEVFFDYRVREGSMLSEAWQKRQQLLDYIFHKKELHHLLAFRECLIENKKLKEEPSVRMLWKQLEKKIKRKLRFWKK